MATTPKRLVQTFHDAEAKRKITFGAIVLAEMATDGAPARKAAVDKARNAHEKACDKEESARQKLADSMKAGEWTDDEVKMFGKYFSTGSRPL